MRKDLIVLALGATLALPLPARPAERIELLAAQPDDLRPAALQTAPEAPPAARDAVTYSWPVASDAVIDLTSPPIVAESRSYALRVTGRELARGIAVDTVSPGAVLRLAPLVTPSSGVTAAPVDPRNLVVTDPRGAAHPDGAGLDLALGAAALDAAGTPFAPGTSAFVLRGELGAGRFTLQTAAASPEGIYQLYVHERSSDVVLALWTVRDAYLAGDMLHAVAELRGGGAALAVAQIAAQAVAPSGRRYPLNLKRQADRRFEGEVRLDSDEGMSDGLWQVMASVRGSAGDLAVRRDGHTAFGYALPTARLAGNVALRRGDSGLSAVLGIETARPGRYEVRGVLFGTAPDGRLLPLGVAHSAAWLEAGRGELELVFGARLFAGSALGAPYEVRDLRLLDQARLGLLQRQARALVIE